MGRVGGIGAGEYDQKGNAHVAVRMPIFILIEAFPASLREDLIQSRLMGDAIPGAELVTALHWAGPQKPRPPCVLEAEQSVA